MSPTNYACGLVTIVLLPYKASIKRRDGVVTVNVYLRERGKRERGADLKSTQMVALKQMFSS